MSLPSKSGRGFRIGDGLIFIAVMSLGLSWVRASWDSIVTFAGPNQPVYDSIRELVSSAIFIGASLAAVGGIALMLTRRSRPSRRPFWRSRRPGELACLASTVVLGLILISQAIRPFRDVLHVMIYNPGEIRYIKTGDYGGGTRVGDIDPFLNTLLLAPRLVGFVIAGGWLALAMAGRWRAEADWRGRLGRAIGIFWIVSAIHFLIFPL